MIERLQTEVVYFKELFNKKNEELIDTLRKSKTEFITINQVNDQKELT